MSALTSFLVVLAIFSVFLTSVIDGHSYMECADVDVDQSTLQNPNTGIKKTCKAHPRGYVDPQENWKARFQWGSTLSYAIGDQKDAQGKGYLCHSSQRLAGNNDAEWRRLYPAGKQLHVNKGQRIRVEHHCNGHCLKPQASNNENDYGQWCLYVSKTAGKELTTWDDIVNGLRDQSVHKVGCKGFRDHYFTSPPKNGGGASERFAYLDWNIPNDNYLEKGKRYFYAYVWGIRSVPETQQVGRFTTCGDWYIN